LAARTPCDVHAPAPDGDRTEPTAGGAPPVPSSPGTYVLVLRLDQEHELAYGKTLRAVFPGGWYLYVGSALGGLRARLNRTVTGPRRPHWHIDRLSEHATLVQVWYRTGSERRECAWSRQLSRSAGIAPSPFPFGASDCRCPTHLFRAATLPGPTVIDDPELRVITVSLGPA
jgi:Uri superfamily endonuclease